MQSAMTLTTTGRTIPITDRVFWELSTKLARKWHPPLILYADPKSAELLTGEWRLKFDEINTDVVPAATRGAHPMCWSAGKLASMRDMASKGKPFLHIDGDAFLFRPLPQRLLGARMFVQCVEKNIELKTAHYRRNCQYPLREFLPLLDLPMWMKKFSQRPQQAIMNMGLFGGNDCASIREFADWALKVFVYNRHNVARQNQFYRHAPSMLGIASIAEQWCLSSYCAWKNIKPETLINSVWSYDLRNKFKFNYIHLYSSIRRLPQYKHWAKHKLKELLRDESDQLQKAA